MTSVRVDQMSLQCHGGINTYRHDIYVNFYQVLLLFIKVELKGILFYVCKILSMEPNSHFYLQEVYPSCSPN